MSTETTQETTQPETRSEKQAEEKARILAELENTDSQVSSSESEKSEKSEKKVESDPKADLKAYAESVGVDPASLEAYGTVENARKAVGDVLEQLANDGFRYTPSKVEAPEAPKKVEKSETPVVNLKELGLSEDDPAAKAFEILQKKMEEQAAVIADLKKGSEQQNAKAAQDFEEQYRQSAETVISSLGDGMYGEAGSRNLVQQSMVQQLAYIHDRLKIGYHNSGNKIPDQKTLLRQAHELHLRSVPKTQVSSSEPEKSEKSEKKALPEVSSTDAVETVGMKMTDKWSRNPELRRRLGLD